MATSTDSPDLGTALALAIVSSSQAPVLLLDAASNVVGASTSFLREFGDAAHLVVGKSLFSLGGGDWDMPRLRSLLSAVGSGEAEIDAYEIDLKSADAPRRSLLLNAQRLDFGADMPVRVLLTISDVTASRAAEKLKDDLIRDKDILLREIQHRVANSLQIIASVLLQNARKVDSEVSRGHLRDAHQRVMSVAAVQQQLSSQDLGDVALKPYFTQLCQSLGASMIADHDKVRIVVEGDGSATTAEASVSLGLIVTELVINALKHAFPDDRPGVVTVDYHAMGTGWSLSVCDDGVGMAPSNDPAKAGLGTAIIQALAAQLSARINVMDLKPGAGVTLVHTGALDGLLTRERPELAAV
ncbi:MAG: histidine kinase [Caulobacteraceae bacterium]|nr:MAG: histidine kinase [Caulobacteraceae bacterium]